MIVARSIEGDTIDLVCWRELGRTTDVVEDALVANPRLADLGPILPIGTTVLLPEPNESTIAVRPTIQLWD